jgi:putative sigma-54 modulation protein
MPKHNKFEGESYKIDIIGNHIEITDAIRSYVFEKLSRVERVATQIIDVHVTLDAQKLEQSCSILMNFIHFHVKVSASTDNMYASIDKAADRLVKLIRKYKSRMQSYRAKHVSTVDIHVNVIQPLKDEVKEINEEIEAENVHKAQDRFRLHEVVAKEKMALKTLTECEAVMKMEITDDPLLIFRDEVSQKVKVIYRRKDHNYGLVQVENP